MKTGRSWPGTFVVALVAIGSGCVSGWYVPLVSLNPVFPGLLTALSLLAGAALVRMARNAPITSPSAFDNDDLGRFFDTLEVLALRLFWIFIQTVVAISVVLLAIVLAGPFHPVFAFYDRVCEVVAGLIVASFLWLFWRLTSMARGDLGFVRLQRQILENALARERHKETTKVISSPVNRVSSGRFGGLAGK